MKNEQTKTELRAKTYLEPVRPTGYKTTWHDLAWFGQYGLVAENLVGCALISSPSVQIELRFLAHGITSEERCSVAVAECSGRYKSQDGWRLIGRPGIGDFWINSERQPDPSETIRRRLLQAEQRQKIIQLPQVIPGTNYRVTSDERMMMGRRMMACEEPIRLLPKGRGKGLLIYGHNPAPVAASLDNDVASFFGVDEAWVESVICD